MAEQPTTGAPHPGTYPTVPAHPWFPASEREVLDFWAADRTFEGLRRGP